MTIPFRRLALAAALAVPASLALAGGIAVAAPQGGNPGGGAAGDANGGPARPAIADTAPTPAPQTYRDRHELRERQEHRGELRRGETVRNEYRHEYRSPVRTGDDATRLGARIRHD